MDTNKTTASSGMLEGAEYEKKLKQYYGDMLVYKSSANSKFFSALSLPSFMRDWLVMRFSNSEGVINKQEVSDYVKRVIPKKEHWNEYLVDLLHNDQTARFLAKSWTTRSDAARTGRQLFLETGASHTASLAG